VSNVILKIRRMEEGPEEELVSPDTPLEKTVVFEKAMKH
jgi:hypothetical protein